MLILGVDPGSQVTGWGLLGGTVSSPSFRDGGEIRLQSETSFPQRLALLQREFATLIDRLQPSSAAVEAPFHGKNSRSALQLAHARGVLLAVLANAGVEVAEYSPATVKKSVTGSGSADKEQVRRMIAAQLGAALADRCQDQTDALAVALCHLSGQRFLQAVGRSDTGMPSPGATERGTTGRGPRITPKRGVQG
jgi:crossover junction endodeoxyribonuclease RuvC